MTTLYLEDVYTRACRQTVSFLRSIDYAVVEEREKAIKVQLRTGKQLWFPKAAIKPHKELGLVLAHWFDAYQKRCVIEAQDCVEIVSGAGYCNVTVN